MKQNLLIFLLLACSPFVFSQAIRPFKLFEIGTGVSVNTVAGDAETYTYTPSYNLSLTFNADPYLNFVGETQFGILQGGNADIRKSETGRYFENSFKAIALRAQLQLGLLLKGVDDPFARSLRSLYAGVGVGAIDNKINKINRDSYKYPGFTTPGINRSLEIYFPVRLGCDCKIKNAFSETVFKVDFGYQYNIGAGDNIDGFVAGKLKDNFSQLFLGLKFCAFGKHWAHSY